MSEEALQTSEVCDNCKRDPEPFEAGNDEGGIETAYYIVVDDDCDGTVLMSGGEMAFRLWPAKEHPISKEKQYLCSSCHEAMGADDEADAAEES